MSIWLFRKQKTNKKTVKMWLKAPDKPNKWSLTEDYCQIMTKTFFKQNSFKLHTYNEISYHNLGRLLWFLQLF